MATKGSGRPSKYVLADGTPVVGVTTVLGRFKESGALIQWAYKRGKAGLDLYGSRDEAADVGSLIHAMVEADIHGLPLPEVPPEFADRCASGFRAWRTWRDGRNMEIVATEVPIVSERHRFGGTIDAIGKDANGLCLLDWKSSNGVYADYARSSLPTGFCGTRRTRTGQLRADSTWRDLARNTATWNTATGRN